MSIKTAIAAPLLGVFLNASVLGADQTQEPMPAPEWSMPQSQMPPKIDKDISIDGQLSQILEYLKGAEISVSVQASIDESKAVPRFLIDYQVSNLNCQYIKTEFDSYAKKSIPETEDEEQKFIQLQSIVEELTQTGKYTTSLYIADNQIVVDGEKISPEAGGVDLLVANLLTELRDTIGIKTLGNSQTLLCRDGTYGLQM